MSAALRVKDEKFIREGKFFLRFKTTAPEDGGNFASIFFYHSPDRRSLVATFTVTREDNKTVALVGTLDDANVAKLIRERKFNKVGFDRILARAKNELEAIVNNVRES